MVAEHWLECPVCDGLGGYMVQDVQTVERIDALRIINEVAKGHGIPVQDLVGLSRRPHIVLARDEAAYRMRAEIDIGLKAIGRYLYNRDHSTIVSAIRRHEARLALV